MTTDTLINALVKAQQEIDHVVQDSKNPFFKSNYASLKEVFDSVKKPMNENGIYIQQESHDCDVGACVETIFYGHGGKMSAGKVTIPAAKHDPQAYGSALSYAKRYSLLMACGVATKAEDDDAEAAMQRTQPAPVRIDRKYKLSINGALVNSYDGTNQYINALRDAMTGKDDFERENIFAENTESIEKAYNDLTADDGNRGAYESMIDKYSKKVDDKK
tara:strand:- start:584 stop:1237 length:654 start_codon:yes stop_codon:yes gene_type:complete